MKDDKGRRVRPGGCAEACAADGPPSSFTSSLILHPSAFAGGCRRCQILLYVQRLSCPFDISVGVARRKSFLCNRLGIAPVRGKY